jgi:hypothetical protein
MVLGNKRKEMKRQMVYGKLYDERDQHTQHPLGRFPSNLLVSDNALDIEEGEKEEEKKEDRLDEWFG